MKNNELEEFGLIKRISSKFNNKRKSTIIGIGDDSAVLNPQKKLMLFLQPYLMERHRNYLIYYYQAIF